MQKLKQEKRVFTFAEKYVIICLIDVLPFGAVHSFLRIEFMLFSKNRLLFYAEPAVFPEFE